MMAHIRQLADTGSIPVFATKLKTEVSANSAVAGTGSTSVFVTKSNPHFYRFGDFFIHFDKV
jgi:hypothetical protein